MEHVLRYVTIGLTIVLIGLIRLGYKNKRVSQENLIKQPLLYFWGGVIIAAGFSVFAILIPFLPTASTRETVIAAIFFSIIMIFFGLAFVWYYITWEIKLDKSTFAYRNFFGKVKEYDYVKCTSVTKSARIDIYHGKKCILRITALSPNWYALSKKLEPNMEIYQKK